MTAIFMAELWTWMHIGNLICFSGAFWQTDKGG